MHENDTDSKKRSNGTSTIWSGAKESFPVNINCNDRDLAKIGLDAVQRTAKTIWSDLQKTDNIKTNAENLPFARIDSNWHVAFSDSMLT